MAINQHISCSNASVSSVEELEKSQGRTSSRMSEHHNSYSPGDATAESDTALTKGDISEIVCPNKMKR
jgi:hypothetical protein